MRSSRTIGLLVLASVAIALGFASGWRNTRGNDGDGLAQILTARAPRPIGNVQAAPPNTRNEPVIPRPGSATRAGEVARRPQPPVRSPARPRDRGDRVRAVDEALDRGARTDWTAAETALLDRSADVRVAGVEALEEFGDLAAIDRLAGVAAEDPDEEVRERAIEALESLEGRDAVYQLGRVVAAAEDHETRIQAIEALESLGGAESVPALRNGLFDSNREVREETIDALAYVGERGAIPALWYRLSQEPDEDLRQAILDALESLDEDVDSYRD